MMIFGGQLLPVLTSPGGRRVSSCMQFLTSCVPRKVTAALLAVLAACVFLGGSGSAAMRGPAGATSGHRCAAEFDAEAAPELSQDVLRAPCLAALTAAEAGGPTIAPPKRTLSINKLCDIKARPVGITGWDKAAIGADHQSLNACSLIGLHIRLQV